MLDRLGSIADGRPVYVLRRPRQVRAFTRALDRDHRLPPPIPPRPARPPRRRAVGGGVLLLALAAAVADHVVGRPADDWARYDHRTFTVAAGDGDGVRLADGTAVRLLGVADPVPAAGDWLADHVVGRPVTLLLPTAGVRDRGRLVAYVYPADGGESVNVGLVRDGLAYADRRQADVMAGLIDVAENDARRKRRGLWDGLRFDRQPAWRQAWVKARAGGP